MNYSIVQIDLNQMSLNMTLLIITFFLAIIIILIFILLKRNAILYILLKNEISDNEDFIDRYADLSDDQINFYFEQGEKQLEIIRKQRDSENASMLGHAAPIAGTFSLFFIIGKWAFHHHTDYSYFLPLVIFLSFALINMGISVFSIYKAYRLPYILPAQINDVPEKYTNTDVRHLKEIFLERLASDAKKNALSNERKIRLFDHSRTFMFYGLASLGVAFIFICCKLYLSFIIS